MSTYGVSKCEGPEPLELRTANRSSSSVIATSATDPVKVLVSRPDLENCEICRSRTLRHPNLCSYCQVWNDARHIFQCMETLTSASSDPLLAVPMKWTLLELRERRNCLICQLLLEAIEERFSETNKDPRTIKVQNAGAYFHPGYQTSEPGSYERHENLNAVFPPQWCDDGPTVHVQACEPPQDAQTQWQIRCVLKAVVQVDLPGISRDCEDSAGIDVSIRLQMTYENYLYDLCHAQRWETPWIPLEQAQLWISSCLQDHSSICRDSTRTLIPNSKIIDVLSMNVVKLLPEMEYLALGYTWRGTNEAVQLTSGNIGQLSTVGGLLSLELPPVLRDALILCRDLGEQYLWIDRLCIEQDSSVRKLSQINVMDRIYSNAKCTIAVATENGGLSGITGVAGNPRRTSVWNTRMELDRYLRWVYVYFQSTIAGTYWSSRGWTFQERLLSPRCLYVFDDEVLFECPEKVMHEFQGYIMDKRQVGHRIPPISNRGRVYSISTISSLPELLLCLQEYTTTNLSCDTDILLAFTGISNVLAARFDTAFFNGLPVKFLVPSLLWGMESRELRRRPGCLELPSWSWAAWLGSARYDVLSGEASTDAILHGTLVRFYCIGNHS